VLYVIHCTLNSAICHSLYTQQCYMSFTVHSTVLYVIHCTLNSAICHSLYTQQCYMAFTVHSTVLYVIHCTLNSAIWHSLHTQQCYMSYRFVDSCRTGFVLVLLESCLQNRKTYNIAECKVNKLLMTDTGTVRNM